ncbi:putative inorganic phosphate cotransporter [Zeugodacus cucurbitae]|uniref:putative inorganic phosphate cotransporter n=1 Tax=Zeugodacus cucurbitae TaxID=28588 RepID=UPI0023D93F61|nr:putative inorganic phosphate cotransporter [Zeugodacus cucurbitae]
MATATENLWLAQQRPVIRAWIKKQFPWFLSMQEHFFNILNVVPQRYILCFFGFLAIVNAYTMRHCLDIALAHIVAPKRKFARMRNLDTIKMSTFNLYERMEQHRNGTLMSFGNRRHDKAGNFDWSEQLQNFILISFYVGYVLSHVPSAQLAMRYGGKWVLAIGLAITALLTLLTPTVVKWGGPLALIAIRLLIGFSAGPTYPALSELLSKWVPGKERATLGSLVLSGSQIGISMGNFIAGLLLHRYDWSLIFYYFGICTLLWFIGFTYMCYNTPEENPFIKVTEKQYLQKEIGLIARCRHKTTKTPWKEIFRNLPMWALISATIQYDWTQLQHAAEVPQFIRDAKQQTFFENIINGMQNQLPYMMNWLLSVLSGVISDLLVNYEIFSVTVMRKIMAFVAAVAPNLYDSLLPCLSCSEPANLFAFCHCAINVLGSYYAGIKLTPLDMSPNFAATLMGIANGLGSLTGIVAPFIKHSFGGWSQFKIVRALLWLMSTLLISAEIQPFDQLISLTTESENKIE